MYTRTQKFAINATLLLSVALFLAIFNPMFAQAADPCAENVLRNSSFEELLTSADPNAADTPSYWQGDAHSRHTDWITPPDGTRYGWTFSKAYQTITATVGSAYELSFYAATHGDVGKQFVSLSYLDRDGNPLGNTEIYTITHIVDTDNTLGSVARLKLSSAITEATLVEVAFSALSNWAKVDSLCLTEKHPQSDRTDEEPLIRTFFVLLPNILR